MRSASVAGRISFLAVRQSEVVLTCGIAIGKSGADVWMVSAEPVRFKELVLETVLAGALHLLGKMWIGLIHGW